MGRRGAGAGVEYVLTLELEVEPGVRGAVDLLEGGGGREYGFGEEFESDLGVVAIIKEFDFGCTLPLFSLEL